MPPLSSAFVETTYSFTTNKKYGNIAKHTLYKYDHRHCPRQCWRMTVASSKKSSALSTTFNASRKMSQGTSTDPYKIAILPGDGAGPEMMEATLEILQALSSMTDIYFQFQTAHFGSEAYLKLGKPVPEETIEICKNSDAVLRGYEGYTRTASTGNQQLRSALGLFAQLRPVVVYKELADMSTLKRQVVEGVDIMVVREVSGGALSIDENTAPFGENESEAFSSIKYKDSQVYRIMEIAASIASRRSGRICNVDKADVMKVSQFWRRCIHDFVKQNISGGYIDICDMYADDCARELILRPRQFDTIITSNLFGDIISEVAVALAGPARLSPSAWLSIDGFGVYGPADVFNISAYPESTLPAYSSNTSREDGGFGNFKPYTSPIAMIRSASMMLRYSLDQPAAADLLQQALQRTMEDILNSEVSQNGSFLESGAIGTKAFVEAMLRSLQYLKQYVQVCDPEICGE